MSTDLMKMSVVAVLAVSLLGCDGVTGPGEGNVTVSMEAVGDGETRPQSASDRQNAGDAQAASAPQSAEGSGEGSIRFRARVSARLSTGEWVELTRRGAEEARVQASGRARAVVMTSVRAREGTYDRIRVEFDEVEASDVQVQLLLGGFLSGSVRVQNEGGSAGRVEHPASWTVRAGGDHRLLIDLNSSAWMRSADAGSRTVSRAAFESAVRIAAE